MESMTDGMMKAPENPVWALKSMKMCWKNTIFKGTPMYPEDYFPNYGRTLVGSGMKGNAGPHNFVCVI
jgi:hypothetical protein